MKSSKKSTAKRKEKRPKKGVTVPRADNPALELKRAKMREAMRKWRAKPENQAREREARLRSYAANAERFRRRAKEKRQTDLERARARARRSYAANREQINEKRRAWAKANPETVKARSTRYYQAHREECRERNRRYQALHADTLRAKWRAHYHAKRKKLLEPESGSGAKSPSEGQKRQRGRRKG